MEEIKITHLLRSFSPSKVHAASERKNDGENETKQQFSILCKLHAIHSFIVVLIRCAICNRPTCEINRLRLPNTQFSKFTEIKKEVKSLHSIWKATSSIDNTKTLHNTIYIQFCCFFSHCLLPSANTPPNLLHINGMENI